MADTIQVVRLDVANQWRIYPVRADDVIDLTLDSKIIKVRDANKDHPLLGEYRVATEYNVWWEAINAAR